MTIVQKSPPQLLRGSQLVESVAICGAYRGDRGNSEIAEHIGFNSDEYDYYTTAVRAHW